MNINRIYYSTTITRFYMAWNNNNRVRIAKYISKFKKIWEKKDILLIEGEHSRLGIGNDLFRIIFSI